MPVTICAAIRDGSYRTIPAPCWTRPPNPYAETSVNRAEPDATSMCVRSPAAFSSSSRSRPIAAPSSAAIASRSSESSQPSEKTLANDRLDAAELLLADALNPDRSQLEQLVEAVAAERVALGRRLHLDQASVARHHHVQVDVCGRVLGVVEIEQRVAADHPDRDGGDRVAEDLAEPEALERPAGG